MQAKYWPLAFQGDDAAGASSSQNSNNGALGVNSQEDSQATPLSDEKNSGQLSSQRDGAPLKGHKDIGHNHCTIEGSH